MDYRVLTPEQKAEMYAYLQNSFNQGVNYSVYSHVRITEVGDLHATGELCIVPELLNQAGILHGGCLVTLADTVAGVAACSRGSNCATANSTMNFLRATHSDKIFCEATAERAGKNLAVFRVTISDESNVLIASGSFTFQMLPSAPTTELEATWLKKFASK